MAHYTITQNSNHTLYTTITQTTLYTTVIQNSNHTLYTTVTQNSNHTFYTTVTKNSNHTLYTTVTQNSNHTLYTTVTQTQATPTSFSIISGLLLLVQLLLQHDDLLLEHNAAQRSVSLTVRSGGTKGGNTHLTALF